MHARGGGHVLDREPDRREPRVALGAKTERLLDDIDRGRDVESSRGDDVSCDRNRNRASLTDANASSRPRPQDYTR